MNPGPRPPASSSVPHRATPVQRGAAWAIHTVIWLAGATQRFRLDDPHRVLQSTESEPRIFAFWHNRLALSVPVYHRVIRPGSAGRRHLAALVSASRDGALLAAVLERARMHPVRGSSSRRGSQALLELKSCLAEGLDLAITPDGPRGPCYRAQAGVVTLASITGRPIVPLSWNSTWKVRLRSWDRFQIPLPFGRWEVRVGAPLPVPPTEDREHLESLRQDLERRILDLTRD